jgi:hypothetical protein
MEHLAASDLIRYRYRITQSVLSAKQSSETITILAFAPYKMITATSVVGTASWCP